MKKCSKCGIEKKLSEFSYSKRYGKQNNCKSCKKECDKEYRKTDKRKEYMKEYMKEYRKTDKWKEYGKEYMKEYKKSDKWKEYMKSDKWKEYMKSLFKKNKENLTLSYFKKRAGIINYRYPPLKITGEQLKSLYDNSSNRCYYCRCELDSDFQFDHKIPYSRGGLNIIDNIVVCCQNCNKEKFTKTAEEYFKQIKGELYENF